MIKPENNISRDPNLKKTLLSCAKNIIIAVVVIFLLITLSSTIINGMSSAILQTLLLMGSFFRKIAPFINALGIYPIVINYVICMWLLCAYYKTDDQFIATKDKLKKVLVRFCMLCVFLNIFTVAMTVINIDIISNINAPILLLSIVFSLFLWLFSALLVHEKNPKF